MALATYPDAPSAYVHVPFCAHRCGYCNFTLVAGRDDLIPRYLAALQHELRTLQHPRAVQTLFLGGGTPTRLPAEALDALLRTLRKWFVLDVCGEFSIEANPTDITPEHVAVLAAQGVNRVSLGVQSFSARKLQVLERDHSPEVIERAWSLLRPHIRSLSLDLIFAAPGESLSDWEQELSAAFALQPDHLSAYGLTYERGTRFYGRLQRGDLAEIAEETQRDMYLATLERTATAGLPQYEVSNFARPGHACRHNLTYWQGGDYHAAGPGAARHYSGVREVNHQSVFTWLARVESGESPVAQHEVLNAEDRAREALVLGLRQRKGVGPAAFAARWGYSPAELAQGALQLLAEAGLIALHEERWELTPAGLLVSDAIWPHILRR